MDAKKSIAKLKAEVQTLHQCTADEPQQQQPQQKDATCVSTHSLVTIHSRYQRVLQIHKDNNCSLVNAFRPGGCSPQHPLRFHRYCQIKNHWWMRTQPGIERHGWGGLLRNSKQSAREDFGSTCQWWLTCVERNSYCYSNSMIAFMSKAVSPFTQMAPWGATNKNDVITTWTNLLENCAKFRGGLGQSWKFKMANRPGISVSVGREILLN